MNEKHQNSHILYLTGLWIILKKFFFHFDIFFWIVYNYYCDFNEK